MNSIALRGTIFYLRDDPFLNPPDTCAVHESDGIVLIENGKISAVGAAREILPLIPEYTLVRHYPQSILIPGFVDAPYSLSAGRDHRILWHAIVGMAQQIYLSHRSQIQRC